MSHHLRPSSLLQQPVPRAGAVQSALCRRRRRRRRRAQRVHRPAAAAGLQRRRRAGLVRFGSTVSQAPVHSRHSAYYDSWQVSLLGVSLTTLTLGHTSAQLPCIAGLLQRSLQPALFCYPDVPLADEKAELMPNVVILPAEMSEDPADHIRNLNSHCLLLSCAGISWGCCRRCATMRRATPPCSPPARRALPAGRASCHVLCASIDSCFRLRAGSKVKADAARRSPTVRRVVPQPGSSFTY